ncbi:putative alpha-1,3-mannosyl-glycoprotein 2-beta-N-acetylglucosaminyltransferase [Helianthus annuus]|nr:putative alpha-1,3-mannosyl-glycoprotein 2-beta-N-acetylglucosaminyltransferase [Helianthus annuus]
MGRWSCDFRYLSYSLQLHLFIHRLVKLFSTQSEYADRVADAVEAENHCRSQMRLLIEQIGTHQENIVGLEEKVKRQEQECERLRAVVQDLEKKGVRSLIQDAQVPVAAVVIMACNRADYLERTINSILKYHSSVAVKFPIFVSQDGSNADVRTKAMGYDQLTYMQHLDYEPVVTERPGELIAYYKIARHYKWALDQLFYKHNFDRVIILEDDMEIAPDFFDYFEAGADLLDKDKSIMAISSWKRQRAKTIYTLYRSDFFPGLGWMLTKPTWDELSPKWPKAGQFIRPEVCRTYNFGEHGSSLGQFFQQYLKPIKLNDVQSIDLSYLMEDKFVKHFADLLKNTKPLFGNDLVLKTNNVNGDVRIHYTDQSHFENIARQFGIFEEWKDGVPRTAYKGIVVFRYQTSKRVFLVGPNSLQQLGIQNS